MSGTGIERRIRRVLPRRGSLVLALDGALIDGPTDSLASMPEFLTEDLMRSVDSVIGYVGLLSRLPVAAQDIPFVANVSGSTSRQNPTSKVKLSTVELAVQRGADAVCYQVHLGDRREQMMLANLGEIVAQASNFGLPVLATVYPRRSHPDGTIDGFENLRNEEPAAFVDLVAHGVRAVVELGAEIVKTTFPVDYEGLARVVSAAMGAPVLVAGGAPVDLASAIVRAEKVVECGAWGVALGRQIYTSPEPANWAAKIQDAMRTPSTAQA